MHQRILAFAKDWQDVPTCITHIMREHAKTCPVLWINSIGVRRPSIAHAGDYSRLLKRVSTILKPAANVENKLFVKSPCLIPSARSSMALAINRKLLNLQTARNLRLTGGTPTQYWCAVPNAVDLLPTRKPVSGNRQKPDSDHKVIYYCVDDWGKFENLDGEWLEIKEKELLREADVVFTPARYLEDKCRRILEKSGRKDYNQVVHRIPHGVEYCKFAAALKKETAVPADINTLPRPIIGFYGNLYPWIDFQIIKGLAACLNKWSFVIIGQPYCDLSALKHKANIHFLGRREHSELPAYCKALDAAVIPYDIKHPRMESINPVKTKELLAAGVPVVASNIPELRNMPGVTIATGIDQWINALRQAVKRKDRKEISSSVRAEDWAVKIKKMREIMCDNEES